VTKGGQPVVIKDGKLLDGVMDTHSIGGEGDGVLLRSLHKKYGASETMRVLHMIFKLGIETLTRNGFSAGLADSDLPQLAREMVQDTLNKAEEEVSSIIQSYHEKSMEVFPSRTAQETLELKILEVLNKARNKCGQIVKEYANKRTHTIVMADSGARGNFLNLAQMAACVGQQAMRGKRIEKGYLGRTLSCFRPGDLTPEAHGFIRHGFKHGLSPKEFFFHAITGRDALMDTALRTPKSGYLYRRLANAMQDMRVEYDQTVRDANGRIIQFEYGEDGVDVAKSESGKIDVKRIIDEV